MLDLSSVRRAATELQHQKDTAAADDSKSSAKSLDNSGVSEDELKMHPAASSALLLQKAMLEAMMQQSQAAASSEKYTLRPWIIEMFLTPRFHPGAPL